MRSNILLLTVMVVSVINNGATFTMRDDTNVDSTGGALGLAEAVKNTLDYLSESKTGIEAISALTSLVDHAVVLLNNSDVEEGSQTEYKTDDVTNEVDTFKVALNIDKQLYLLSINADDLIQAVGAGDNTRVTKNILSIKRTAASLIKEIQDLGIAVIIYQNPRADVEEVSGGKTKRSICIGFRVWGACVGIGWSWGKRHI